MKLIGRIFALWAAVVAFGFPYGLWKAYDAPGLRTRVAGFFNRQWSGGYFILPRMYMIAIAVISMIGLGCVWMAFSANPSTRPPFFPPLSTPVYP